jgi:hypothetical protein
MGSRWVVDAEQELLRSIDPKLHLFDHTGRPVPVLDDSTPIEELL